MAEKINLADLNVREGDTGDFIKHIDENCMGCGRCTEICAASLWSIKDGIARLSPKYKERCLECAACVHVCNFNAIIFRYPNSGTGIQYLHG
ncbi:MAG: DUF362 domain-containing protein [Candidatus Helarchaeota archaeon]